MLTMSTFRHRSGRIIGLGRATLAAFFLVAVWVDGEAGGAQAAVQWVLASYLVASLLLLALTWNNWWLDARLAAPAHVADLLAFTALNLLQDYESPFFTFFVFIILSATVRWSWRETALTGAALILCYLLAGVSADSWGTEEFDLRRFVIRSAYLIVLSALLMWFGINQQISRSWLIRGLQLDKFPASAEPPVSAALGYAAERLAAGRVVFAWCQNDEPTLTASSWSGGSLKHVQLARSECGTITDPALGTQPFLFDAGRGRVLYRPGGRMLKLKNVRDPIEREFADRFEIGEGLRVYVESDSYRGDIFFLDLQILCAEDLKIGALVAQQISIAFERSALIAASEEAVAARSRLALARDLHDSTAQFLAGLAMRLRALVPIRGNEEAVDRELEELGGELAREQKSLRSLIRALRQGELPVADGAELDGLPRLVGELERQWDIIVKLSATSSIPASPRFQYEVYQIVREAVANAARHGDAGEIELNVAERSGNLDVTISDNGTGFGFEGEFDGSDLYDMKMGPRSLRERVDSLGGAIAIRSAPQGAQIQITLPMRGSDYGEDIGRG